MSSGVHARGRAVAMVVAATAVAATLMVVALDPYASRSARAAGAVMVGAGDVAECPGPADGATARLLDDILGTVFTVGDNAYPSGAAYEFTKCNGQLSRRISQRPLPRTRVH